MNIDKLKTSWEQQKKFSQDQLIAEDDILAVIQQELNQQAKIRTFLCKASSFVVLLIFCQSC